jgi:hypothetical protein
MRPPSSWRRPEAGKKIVVFGRSLKGLEHHLTMTITRPAPASAASCPSRGAPARAARLPPARAGLAGEVCGDVGVHEVANHARTAQAGDLQDGARCRSPLQGRKSGQRQVVRIDLEFVAIGILGAHPLRFGWQKGARIPFNTLHAWWSAQAARCSGSGGVSWSRRRSRSRAESGGASPLQV